jgi:GPH family glycoside/pentoside/hexuronide:cation symporter
MSEIDKSDLGAVILHSKKNQASYGTASLVTHLIDMVLVSIIFFFYEVEIGLSSWLTALGIIIYAVWDAFNDPLVGHLTDRPFKFTKKWGRRFPWMMISYIPWLISFLLLFTPPDVNNQWIIFGWLVATLCIYDFLETIFTVNFGALFPDKFRDGSERISTSAFVVYIGFGGVFGALLIPPLLITFGDIGSYVLMALVCIVISFICGIFMISGLRDDKESVERYIAKYEELQKKESFFKVLKQSLKQKSFIIFLIMYILYLSLTHLMTGSLIYFVRYVLLAEAATIALITLALLVGGLVSIPFWIKINKKIGDNRKTMILGGIIMIFFASLLSVFTNLTLVLITTFLFGFGLGGYWVMIEPVFSQVIDESVISFEERREGIYNGIRVFFSRAAVGVQAITLLVVHELTGFIEGAEIQPPLALIGIRLHMGLIPAVFMAIGLLVFWKFFDITPEKANQFKEGIIKLKL